MHVNIAVYGYIYPYIQHLGVQVVLNTFTVYSHPGSWCTLHQAHTAIIHHHLAAEGYSINPATL